MGKNSIPKPSKKFLVDKLLMLGQRVGPMVHQSNLEPFPFSTEDIIEIQVAAKKIAESIGLNDYVFIVTYENLGKDTAGQIELTIKGSDVFVTIDTSLKKFPYALAATLCHEVCHKWLQTKGISLPIEIENEFLTDITCVFLGFGKIMLNGCIDVRTKKITSEGTIISESLKSGYLEMDDFAFVYAEVCKLRWAQLDKTSKSLQSLTSDAKNAVTNNEYGKSVEYSQDILNSLAMDASNTMQSIAELNKLLTYIQDGFCNTIESHIKKAHKTLLEQSKLTKSYSKGFESNPRLQTLYHYQISAICDTVRGLYTEIQNFLRQSKEIVWIVSNDNRFPSLSAEMFYIVQCPICSTKLRLPKNSGSIRVSCPSCQYAFLYNTNVPSINNSEQLKDYQNSPTSRDSVWSKFGKWFSNIDK